MKLEGKVAIVTGASAGIGRDIAYYYAKEGAKVLAVARRADRLNDLAESAKDLAGEIVPYAADMSDKTQVEAMVEEAIKRFGTLDILVNNAGIQKRAPLEEFSLSDWEALIDVNLTGVFLVSQCVAKGMIKRKAGKIINICSLQSELARPTIAPYAASKGGVKMLTKAMAAEWAKHNIQVNGIAPGYFITDMTKPLAENEKFDSWIKSRTPAGRWGDVKELVGATIFLASEASSYINGHILFVDGGLSSVV